MNKMKTIRIRKTLNSVSASYDNDLGTVIHKNGDIENAVKDVIHLGFEPDFDIGFFVPRQVRESLKMYGV